MLIVALETATRAGSVALATHGHVVSKSGDPARPHGDRLPAELTSWVEQHGHQIDDVDLFAVVSGPGSFTGLRVGIATIQGLCFAASKRVVAVPTLDALAESHWPGPAEDVVLVACLDGQRGEVFAAAWDARSAGHVDDARVLVPPLATRPEALADTLAGEALGRDVVMVGDGAIRYADVINRGRPGVQIVAAEAPLADSAVRLAARWPDRASSPHALRPIYLRQPDAARPGQRAAPEYRIRRIDSRDDLSAIETLQRQTFANPWGADAIRWELQNTDVARVYVMENPAGAVVAYCACWMVFDELHINSLAVDAAERRQGHARRLLQHVLDEAARAGATAATLEVRASNEPARRLYEGLGFSVEGVRRDYYQDPREDAIILWTRNLQGDRAARRA